MTNEITVGELQKKLKDFKVIDVRRPDEFTGELGHIHGANLATLDVELDSYLDKLSKDEVCAFVCRSGGRSFSAMQIALDKGFKNVFNVKGGMLAWNAEGLPIEK